LEQEERRKIEEENLKLKEDLRLERERLLKD
jgi:hypothetical protein